MLARAAALTHPRESLSLVEVSLPALSDGDVLVRVEAVGLGAADFGFFQLDALPRVPLVVGLEAVGVVEASQSAVPVGTRVGLVPLHESCGACSVCTAQRPAWCAQVRLRGWHVDGLLSTHVVARASSVVRLDSDVDATRAAPVFASGWTAVSAVHAAGLSRGQTLGLLGAGGVGQLAFQVASSLGLTVQTCDVDASRAKACGGSTRALAAESVDAVVVATPSTQAIQQAMRAVRRGGIVVLAAASPAVRFDVSLFDTVMRGVTLRPVFLGAPSELDEAVRRFRDGSMQSPVHVVKLDDVPTAYWMLRDGGFTGRLVVRL